MEQDTELIAAEAEREAEQAADSRALYEVKMKFLGRAGKVTELLKGMKNVAQEHRPASTSILTLLGASPLMTTLVLRAHTPNAAETSLPESSE